MTSLYSNLDIVKMDSPPLTDIPIMPSDCGCAKQVVNLDKRAIQSYRQTESREVLIPSDPNSVQHSVHDVEALKASAAPSYFLLSR